MKIVRKIMPVNTLHIISIAVLYSLLCQTLRLVLGKLRFLDISDALTASFLDMRLSEKELFLVR